MAQGAQQILKGRCLCGQYTFHILSQYIKFGYASCHCSICRLSHGAPFVQWSGIHAKDSHNFTILRDNNHENAKESLSSYRSSISCVRKFCGNCGTHVFIEYDRTHDEEMKSPWEGEIHFPTALLDEDSLNILEQTIQELGKPRYLHVFYSNRSSCLGDLQQWANGPKYGGESGLVPVSEDGKETT